MVEQVEKTEDVGEGRQEEEVKVGAGIATRDDLDPTINNPTSGVMT